MSKKEKLQDIKNNSKAHKHPCKEALAPCCFVKNALDMDLLKAHLKIDRANVVKYIKELTKEAKEVGVKII